MSVMFMECEDKSVDVESQGKVESGGILFHGSTFVHSLFLFTIHIFDYFILHYVPLSLSLCFIIHHGFLPL